MFVIFECDGTTPQQIYASALHLSLHVHILGSSYCSNTTALTDKWGQGQDLSSACLAGLSWLNFVAQQDTVVYEPTIRKIEDGVGLRYSLTTRGKFAF